MAARRFFFQMPNEPASIRDPLTYAIIGAALRVRKALGCGLLESAYHAFLCHELRKVDLAFSTQETFPVVHEGVTVQVGFRTDLVVENSVVIEIKAVEKLLPVHKAQLLTYMRLAEKHKGLLFNFNAIPFSNGIIRMIL